jgi:hypothetical protein
MSIDGPGILESDLAHDAYNEILDLYDSGISIAELRQRIAAFEESLSDKLEEELYLAAAAKAFWEIGHLPQQLSTRLSQLIESGASLALWARDVDENLAKARRATLLRLLRQIAKPRAKPRPRKKYPTVRTKLYSVGDCVQLAAGKKVYRGVVCKVLEYRGQCEYALLVMAPAIGSTNESFESGNYYGRRIPSSLDTRGYVFGPHVIRIEHSILVRADNPFQSVGRVELDESKYCLGSFGGILNMKDVIEDFERTETKAKVFGNDLLPLRQLMRHEPVV